MSITTSFNQSITDLQKNITVMKKCILINDVFMKAALFGLFLMVLKKK